MKEMLKKITDCNDINAIKNTIIIMSDYAETEMTGKARLEMMKSIQSELAGCHYDDELSSLHLAIIGDLCSKDVAMTYWKMNNMQEITVYDWLVLWGEMTRRNRKKIRTWFPQITTEEFRDRVFDECKAFLESGGDPFRDLSP